MLLNPAMAATEAPPVMEARRWIDGVTFPADRPLMNLSQAAPVAPPPRGLREAMADAALNDDAAHLYGPVLGLPALREAVAGRFSRAYAADLRADQVAITSGCNQAFAAALATLAGDGDEVILPTPWYFNHKMWLDMAGIHTVALPPGPGLVPDPDAARAAIGPRTRAIVLVTPNNPTGVEYPADILSAFRDLARARGLALLIDETYRDFDARSGPPHAMLSDADWDETVIQLYSFSKAYRLTGHRVGALLASTKRLEQVEKFLDTVAICPGQIGQRAALWGLRHLDAWLADERAEILDRRAAIVAQFQTLAAQGWALAGGGAYFAYVRHPFALPSDALARQLVREAGLLCLPGTMFMPAGGGRAHLRLAFANVDRAGIADLGRRLAALDPARLAPETRGA